MLAAVAAHTSFPHLNYLDLRGTLKRDGTSRDTGQ